MKLPLRRLALPFLALPLALAAGCGDDDNSAGPGGGTPLDQATAQQAAVGALSVVDALVAEVDAVANGDLTALGGANLPGLVTAPAPRGGATWDPDLGAWTFSFTHEDETGTISWSYLIRFLAGGEPVQDHSIAEQIHMEHSYGIVGTFSDGTNTTNTDLQYGNTWDADLTAGGRGGPAVRPAGVVGTGALTGRLSGTAQGSTYDYVLDLGWLVDVATPGDGGCSAGSVEISVADWTVSASYDGTSTISWQMSSSSGVVASGTEISECGF